MPYILGQGETVGIPFPAGLSRQLVESSPQPIPTKLPGKRKEVQPSGHLALGRSPAEVPRIRGSSSGWEQPVHGDPSLWRCWSGPQSFPPTPPVVSRFKAAPPSGSLVPSATKPHLPPCYRRGHVRRARGTNERLARNGRDCLTPVTSQSWRGARCSSAPPSPPRAGAALLLSAHSPLRSQSGGGKCSGPDVRAGQGGGPAGQGVGQLGAWGRTPGS